LPSENPVTFSLIQK